MATTSVVLLLGASSLILMAAVWCGRARSRRVELRWALASTLLFVGLWALSLALNIVLGFLAVFLLRSSTTRFVSAYLVNDISVVIFSACQAAFIHAWSGATRQR
jgi:hypothetical protein